MTDEYDCPGGVCKRDRQQNTSALCAFATQQRGTHAGTRQKQWLREKAVMASDSSAGARLLCQLSLAASCECLGVSGCGVGT